MPVHAWKPESAKPRKRLPVDTIALAQALLGTVLVSETAEGITAAEIVETEAYPPDDPASHAYSGKRQRNAVMFGEPHHAYVYLIYGTAYCFNVTSERDGTGAGVLVRAAVPLYNLELMRLRRPGSTDRDLCRGPGRLCAALGIDVRDNGLPLLQRGRLWLARGVRPLESGRSVRIGLTKAMHETLRFYVRGNACVSGVRALSP